MKQRLELTRPHLLPILSLIIWKRKKWIPLRNPFRDNFGKTIAWCGVSIVPVSRWKETFRFRLLSTGLPSDLSPLVYTVIKARNLRREITKVPGQESKQRKEIKKKERNLFDSDQNMDDLDNFFSEIAEVETAPAPEESSNKKQRIEIAEITVKASTVTTSTTVTSSGFVPKVVSKPSEVTKVSHPVYTYKEPEFAVRI